VVTHEPPDVLSHVTQLCRLADFARWTNIPWLQPDVAGIQPYVSQHLRIPLRLFGCTNIFLPALLASETETSANDLFLAFDVFLYYHFSHSISPETRKENILHLPAELVGYIFCNLGMLSLFSASSFLPFSLSFLMYVIYLTS
jgi:hypothetical protein